MVADWTIRAARWAGAGRRNPRLWAGDCPFLPDNGCRTETRVTHRKQTIGVQSARQSNPGVGGSLRTHRAAKSAYRLMEMEEVEERAGESRSAGLKDRGVHQHEREDD